MVKHIVAWRLQDFAEGKSKAENAAILKEKLESLNGKIEGLIRLEVGIDFSRTDASSDVVLYSEFRTKSDLDGYQEHPLHKAIQPFVTAVRADRRMVDYEV